MKKTTLLLSFLSIIIFSQFGHSQDVIFSQFENAPLYLNSALTGNYDDQGRVYLNYRRQWATALKSGAHRSGSLGLDSKIAVGKKRSVGYGISTFLDRAGEVNFGTNQFNLHSSLIQKIGNVEKAHHSIALGVKLGFSRLRIIEDGTNYIDISPGIVWSYFSNARFSFQVGSSIDHINRPNISFSQTGTFRLYGRFNLHGNIEIPILKKISVVPSFLFSRQGPHEQLTFGSDCKYLFKSNNRYNPFTAMNIGFFGRAGLDYKDERTINTVIFRTSFETKAMSFGLSYDSFISNYRTNFGGPSIELSLGYKFGNRK